MPWFSKKSKRIENVPPEGDETFISRQALHALRLCFDHPVTGERMQFEAPLADDIQRALEAVRQHGPRVKAK